MPSRKGGDVMRKLTPVEQNAVNALEICERAYVIESGRIELADEVRALLRSPAVRQRYLGIR